MVKNAGSLVIASLFFLCYTSAHQIPRTETGRIIRDSTIKKEFMQQTGYPKGRAGFQVDHVIPLHKGGCDTTENLQWLTIEEHRKKSATERTQ